MAPLAPALNADPAPDAEWVHDYLMAGSGLTIKRNGAPLGPLFTLNLNPALRRRALYAGARGANTSLSALSRLVFSRNGYTVLSLPWALQSFASGWGPSLSIDSCCTFASSASGMPTVADAVYLDNPVGLRTLMNPFKFTAEVDRVDWLFDQNQLTNVGSNGSLFLFLGIKSQSAL
ncbi:MAG: hypothetical protein HY299_09840 [Verrucomicrobia bacterium]|nr:hypothetical protein [Verrucomicrobiota bacterium]